MTRPIHEITHDHASWLREHVARMFETEAEFEDLVANREVRLNNPARSSAHRERANVYRDMAQQIRPKEPRADPKATRNWSKWLTQLWSSAQRQVVHRNRTPEQHDVA